MNQKEFPVKNEKNIYEIYGATCIIQFTKPYIAGFDELRNVVRFLSFQADDSEDLESNDILGNGKMKEVEKSMAHEKVPKRLEVASDVTDSKDGGRRRSVRSRNSSFRNKEKRKRLQRLASMPGRRYSNIRILTVNLK